MRKWRPSLALVLGGALAATLALSYLGLIALRYLGPEIGFRNAAVLLAGIIATLTALLGWMLVRLLLRPIHALERYAQMLEAGAPDCPAPAHFGTRELHSTARQVMRMGEALRDREATIRAYTDHVTHELKTPVSAIKAGAELLEDSPDMSAPDRTVLQQVSGAVTQIEAQLAGLRDMARAREARYLGTTTLAQIAQALRGLAPELALHIDGADVTVPLAQDGVILILGQLIQNAAHHGATHMRIEAFMDASLSVHDNGPGISPGNRARIFEPFFTTRRDMGGTGMGLAVVRGVLQAHGGTIDLLDSAQGAQFSVRLRQ